MPGGSREPEGDDETQCQHCGLWYGQEGVLPHERTCDLAGYDARKVPLTDPKTRVRAGLDPDPDAGADELQDGAASDPGTTHPDDGSEPAPAPESTVTDGGPRSVPSFNVDDGDTDAPADDGPSCPDCETSEYLVPVEVLPDAVLEHERGPSEKDVLCLECSSTTDDGALQPETVDGEEVLRIVAFDRDEVVA